MLSCLSIVVDKVEHDVKANFEQSSGAKLEAGPPAAKASLFVSISRQASVSNVSPPQVDEVDLNFPNLVLQTPSNDFRYLYHF